MLGTCRECGCTDWDCRRCVQVLGHPCSWVEPDLCTACVPGYYEELRRRQAEALRAAVHRELENLEDEQLTPTAPAARAIANFEGQARAAFPEATVFALPGFNPPVTDEQVAVAEQAAVEIVELRDQAQRAVNGMQRISAAESGWMRRLRRRSAR